MFFLDAKDGDYNARDYLNGNENIIKDIWGKKMTEEAKPEWSFVRWLKCMFLRKHYEVRFWSKFYNCWYKQCWICGTWLGCEK